MNSGSRSAFSEGQRAQCPLDIELVFHPLGDSATGESAAFAEATRRVLDADTAGEVLLVCPYLSSRVVSRIVQDRVFRLVTDMQACFDAGADEPLAAFLEGNLHNVRHMPEVHAKVVCTNQAALLGSANLTQSGFAARDEMGCLIGNASLVRTLREWFDHLWSASRPIRKEDIQLVRHRPPRRHRRRASEAVFSSKTVHMPIRSIGWLVSRAGRLSLPNSKGMGHTPPANQAELREERTELVAQIKALAASRAEADTVLGLLAEALDVAGLPLDDGRLHLNFGKNPICVNINQRYVAWCSVERRIHQFGFILNSEDAATDGTRLLEGSWSGNFRRGGVEDLWTLHVPLAQLSRLPLAVLDSWRRAIRVEVDRRRRDGAPWTSSYRKHTRPYLFYVLSEESLRKEIVGRAFPGFWWFGVNNGPHGHVRLDDMRSFLTGSQKTFIWPFGRSKPKRLYREMRAGDCVLIWTGHGRDSNWGIIGHAGITHVCEEDLTLDEYVGFPSPIIPYPSRHPQETYEVKLLQEVFGAEFVPLGDVMRAVYGTRRTPPTTISGITEEAFRRILNFADSRDQRMLEMPNNSMEHNK
mgnify:FL=1